MLEDVANPCAAADELPSEERARRARQLELYVCVGAVRPDPSQSSEGVHVPKTRSRNRKHECTPTCKRRCGSGEKQAVQPSDDPVDAPGGQDGQRDTQKYANCAITCFLPGLSGCVGQGR